MQPTKRAGSRSDVQAEAEKLVLAVLSQSLGVPLVSGKVTTGDSYVEVDGLWLGLDKKRAVLVEVFAHVGAVKAAQRHKVQADVFKLTLAKEVLAEGGFETVEAYCAFVCTQCARSIEGRTWVRDAARRSGIGMLHAEISPDALERLVSAQKKQNLLEPPL